MNIEDLRKYASQDLLDINSEIFGQIENMGANKIGKTKFRNVKTVYNGRKFDSKAEARHYASLLSLETKELITDLECQPKFVLLPAFVDNQGKKIQAITYKADFKYFDVGAGKWYIVDVKSKPTSREQSFRNKWKMLQYKYRDDTSVVLELVIT